MTVWIRAMLVSASFAFPFQIRQCNRSTSVTIVDIRGMYNRSDAAVHR
jgi:hypothetical protein